MKKLISVFLTLCLILACMFTVVACNNDNNNNQTSENSGETSTQSTSSQGVTSSKAPTSTITSSSKTWNSIKSTDRPEHKWEPATDMVLGTNDGTQSTTVFLVGDSTVCNYDNETAKYYPRNGYGMWFDDFLNADKVTVKNLARSGRSSREYLTYENGQYYNMLTSEIKEGDYLVIGFGHNDQKTDKPGYYTNPNSQVTDDDSFKYYLYKYYVKVALDAGATPILCTPIVRQSSSGDYTGAKIHITSGSGDNFYEGGDYVKAIKELGEEFGITVIDLTTVTKNIMETAGNEGSKIYYASKNPTNLPDPIDQTHINAYGAAVVAYNFMLEIQKTDNTLKFYVDSDKMVEPTQDVLVPNVKEPASATQG